MLALPVERRSLRLRLDRTCNLLDVRLYLCGVRGSSPTPGPEFTTGGHTSCVAVAHDDEAPRLVLDGGTGLRILTEVLDGKPFRGTLVLSHLHWDHMMGLPFFASGDHPDSDVRLLLPEQGEDAETLLGRAMSPPNFPITPSQLRGRWRFETYDEGELEIEGFTVLTREIPHTGGRTMGFRVADSSGSIAYLSDHAPHQLGAGENGVGELHPAACALADGVDVLVHDAQYTRYELPDRLTWGHAAADYSAELAERCGARRILLFHHDPMRTDAELTALRNDVALRTSVPVELAVQGVSIDI
jgi:phosphoribosyl 1,2-cyclic phosphodiesterase